MGARETPAVEFDGVSLAFDEHVVLHDVSFTVPKGSMRILLGASGAGKSVMLKLILGLFRPDSRHDPRQRPARRRRCPSAIS